MPHRDRFLGAVLQAVQIVRPRLHHGVAGHTQGSVLLDSLGCRFGARGRTRTGTESPPRDFKSLASTCSATRADTPPRGRRRVCGGWGRNRTGVHGFAGRCMTTLPPSRRDPRAGGRSEGTVRGRPRNDKTPLPAIEQEGPGVSWRANWSGKRDSNSRPQPWQGCALPTELFPPLAHSSRQPGSVKP